MLQSSGSTVKRGSHALVHFAGPQVESAQAVDVQAPTDPNVDTLWIAPRGPNGLHGWPVALALSDLDEVMEQEPNNEPAKANRLTVPCGITARFLEKADIDHFVFSAKKGQRLSAEVEGIRLGRTTFDPRLAVLDTNGVILADVDDSWLALQDPFVSILVPHDGTYLIQLRESTYGGNDNCHYRLHLGGFPRPTAVYPLGGKAGDDEGQVHQPDVQEVHRHDAPPLTGSDGGGHKRAKVVKHGVAGALHEGFAAGAIAHLDQRHQHEQRDVDRQDDE